MKKGFVFFLCMVFYLFINHHVQSQEENLNIKPSKISYAEKVYLQLNNTIFTTDETVWFKTIVTDANHVPTKLSSIIHVELIDFDERVIDQKLLKLENGIADSFFQLNESFPTGRYLIRAYTEWNKNFHNDFISKRYIDLYAPKKILETDEPIRDIVLTETASKQFQLSAKVYPRIVNPIYRGKLMLYLDMDTKVDSVEIKKDKGTYSFNYLLPKDVVRAKMELKLDSVKLKNNKLGFLNTYSKTLVVDKTYLDLQFFPEGGKLVDGLTSKVAFKALDYKNKGKKVFGHIVDQNDSIITGFKSNSLGMGVLDLKADIKKTYYGSIKNNKGVEYKYILPKIYNSGYVFTAKDTKDYIRININSNYSKQDSLYLKVQSRGITYHDINLKLNNSLVNVAIEKHSLPEGIIKLTLLNKNKQPICERLVFNFKEDNRVKITANTNLNSYSQRDKTIINLNTNNKDGNAISSNLSVLVLNKEQLETNKDKQQNILSYFLLNSELRGTIETPSSYFDKKNKHRYSDIDALMLTQGWRNYIYENLQNDIQFKIKPEKSLSVTGTVGEFFNPRKRPKKPIDLTMLTFEDPKTVITQKVDSTGRFNFQIGDVYSEELEFLIQSVNNKGKKKDYTINIDKKNTPKINYEKQELLQLSDSIIPHIQKSLERKQAEEAFKIASGTITLDEVHLSGYKLTPEREKIMELHGPPDVVIENKELVANKKKWSYGLFSVLMFSYPDDISIRRVGSGGGFLIAEAFGADFTFVLIDGKLVELHEYQLLGSLPTEEIKSVEILNSPKNWIGYFYELFPPFPGPGIATFSIISIYTYSKIGLYGIQRNPGIFKNIISGFTPKREFYAPKHKDLTREDWNIPDLRSVVHWEPNVTTDLEGNAQVEFYNDDNTGDMLVIVEGITSDGKIGYYETTYRVDEKLEK